MKDAFAIVFLVMFIPFYVIVVLFDRLTGWLLDDKPLTDLQRYIEEIKDRLKNYSSEGE